MSSYLNLYLLPKKKEGDTIEPKPLLLNSWSRNSDIYQMFYENLNPTFIGDEDEYKYSEVTEADLQTLVDAVQKDINTVQERLQARTEALSSIKNIPPERLDEYIEDFASTREYIRELQDTLELMKALKLLLSDLEYSSFEKILVNID